MSSTPSPRTSRWRRFFPLALAVKTTEKMPERVSAQVLAKTSPNSWLKRDMEELKAELRAEGRPLLNERLDEKGPVPVAAVATVTLRREGSTDKEPKKARIVVFGDSDFASNNYLNLSGNRDLFLNTVSWLAEEENLIAIRPKEGGSVLHPGDGHPGAADLLAVDDRAAGGGRGVGCGNLHLEETERMSWKNTLGLVVVAALLGGYYYWYEVKGGEQRKAAEEAAQRIFQLKKDAIEAVTITRGQEVIKLAKDANEGWMLIEPVRAKADQRTVDEVLDGLVEGKRDKVIAEQAADLADFGLKEPSLVVRSHGQRCGHPHRPAISAPARRRWVAIMPVKASSRRC